MHLCYIDKLFREIALHAIFGLSSAAYVHSDQMRKEEEHEIMIIM